MYSLKSLARRTTQSIREKLSGPITSPSERDLLDGIQSVKELERFGGSLSAKIVKLAKLMEDVGQTLKEIGEEYQQTPKISPDAVEMAQQLIVLGNAVVDSSHQHQKEIHNDGYKVVQKFTKQCPRLAQLEEARGSAKLEYDFFKRKVDTLKGTPQTDPSRLPRNEQRLESWRVELWKASESSRAAASELFLAGRNACDTGVYTVTTVLKSFFKTVHDAFSSEVRIVSAPSVFNDVLLPPLPLTPRGGSAHPVEAPARLEDPSPLRSTSTPSQPSAGYSVMGEGRPPLFSLSDDSPPYRGSASPYGGERPSIFSSYTDPNSKASTYQPPMMQSEPQFATVTLLNLTNENEQTTLRVPVGNETTVKQLAKEAMRRWVVLKRFSKEQMPLPVITQVYVGGSDTQPSADVFAHDVVTQVIAVRSEMVFMKLSLQSPQKNKTEPAAASETVSEGTRAVEKAAKEKKPSPPPKKVEKEEAKLPKDFPIDKVNEKSRLKWGPSAHLLFPENYESSPGKRAKRTRTRSEKPKDASGDENTKRKIPAPKVSRQIEFNEVDDASEGERPTVAHEVKLDESPAEPEVKLPKGWGRDALKYFDPETYCDDPRKAKIPPGMTFKSRRSCVN